MNLIADNTGTDPLRFIEEIIGDVCLALEPTDHAGMILEVILYTHCAWVWDR